MLDDNEIKMSNLGQQNQIGSCIKGDMLIKYDQMMDQNKGNQCFESKCK